MGGKRYASEAERQPNAYIANVQALGSGWSEAGALPQLDIARELIAMGLRPTGGINLDRIEGLSNASVSREKIDVFVEQGWARFDGAILSLTPSGWLLADAITAQLAP